MNNLGCERVDSNHRPLAYEANELPSAPLRNGCTRGIRTPSLGYGPSELPLLHQCYIRGKVFPVGAPTTAHERK